MKNDGRPLRCERIRHERRARTVARYRHRFAIAIRVDEVVSPILNDIELTIEGLPIYCRANPVSSKPRSPRYSRSPAAAGPTITPLMIRPMRMGRAKQKSHENWTRTRRWRRRRRSGRDEHRYIG